MTIGRITYTKMAKAMLEQPEGKSFVIIDGKSMKASKRLQSFLKSGYFVEAQTIPELAQKIGIPPENLEKTIKRYAEFVRNGKDLDFGRSINMKTDFSTPPYYASAILPGTQVSVGGVDVNDFMQCVKADGKVIPNLCGWRAYIRLRHASWCLERTSRSRTYSFEITCSDHFSLRVGEKYRP